MAINPLVDITNYSESIPVFYSVKRFYSIINFKDFKFFVYGLGEESDSGLVPAQADSFYFWSAGNANNWTSGSGSPVPFINDLAWGDYGTPGIVNSPSGFLAPTGTLFPKLAIPSFDLVDNGIEIGTDVGAYGERRGVFNWTVSEINGSPAALSGEEILDYLETSGEEGAKYVSIKYKDDDVSSSSIKLNCQVNSERSAILSGYAPVPDSLVGHGACLLMINVAPNNSGGGTTGLASGDETWRIKIDFPTGEISLSFDNTGSMLVDVAGTITKAQLNQSRAKEQPPQFQQLCKNGQTPYCIVIYPVWNGVVVSDGIQDAVGNTVTSQYCPKDKRAHPTDETYFGPAFDPQADLGTPESLWGGDGSGSPSEGGSDGDFPTTLNFEVSSPSNVTVNFGSSLTAGIDVEFNGCRADIAYLPLFHLPNLRFDQFYLSGTDGGDNRYWQWIYPIWTANNGYFVIDRYNIDLTYSNPTAGTGVEYRRMEVTGFSDDATFYDRYGGEIFGYYFQSDEDSQINVINGDGNYPLVSFWNSPGANVSGDPSPISGWKNYIENLNVSIGLEGSNGSISVDKYGIAGQRAEPIQNIGSLRLYAYGTYPGDFNDQWDGSHPPTAYGKTAGTDNILYTGIGMGVAQSDDSNGGSFSIPLEGRYKKLEDIMLINAPYFDGYELVDVLEFLCKYGGLFFNSALQYHGNVINLTTPIVSSENISSPIVDFKAGTSILDALNQICELTHHSFYIKRDGKIHFYELGSNGLPVTGALGYDWAGLYGSTGYTLKMNSKDSTPDFADLRNQIVGIAQTETNASGSDIKEIPLFPLTVALANPTTPTIPWSKQWVYPINGVVDETTLNGILNNAAALSQRYLLSGNITIAGNPYIEPYDRWTIEGTTYIVESVGHSIDFNGKTWNTTVQLFGA